MRYTLSGGEAQRASLARAFALEPEILMMDEPFSSVDNISRQGLIKTFKEVQSEKSLSPIKNSKLRGATFTEKSTLSSLSSKIENAAIAPDTLETKTATEAKTT